MAPIKVRLGVDVGGTNTDAVVIQESDSRVLSHAKRATSSDVSAGISAAAQAALSLAHSRVEHGMLVRSVMVGTTHLLNALKTASEELSPVGVLRLCSPGGRSLTPFSLFPRSLRARVEVPSAVSMIDGGFEFDGSESVRLCEALEDPSSATRAALDEFARVCVKHRLTEVVVSGVFSAINNEQERRVADYLGKAVPEQQKKQKSECEECSITLSSDVAGMGLIERENAAILNASLKKLARKIVAGLHSAMASLGLDESVSLFITQNDGTVLSAARMVELPVCTFASGPTNSMRGASALLASLQSDSTLITEAIAEHGPRKEYAIAVDIGGTTSDAGLIVDGFPLPSAVAASVAGVRTNFHMPRVSSVALGGGSIVDFDSLSIGPESVGFRLGTQSVLFGGPSFTLTDLAVSQGTLPMDALFDNFGVDDSDRRSVLKKDFQECCERIGKSKLQAAYELANRKLLDLIESVCAVDRSQAADGVRVVLCGGGAALFNLSSLRRQSDAFISTASDEESAVLSGLDSLGELGAVANAFGAALGQIAGQVDTLEPTEGLSDGQLSELQSKLVARAKQDCIRNGGSEELSLMKVLFVEQTQVKYIPRCMVRFQVKVYGPPSIDSSESCSIEPWSPDKCKLLICDEDCKEEERKPVEKAECLDEETIVIDDDSEDPPFNEAGVWEVSIRDVEYLAVGCGLLGCGGGGSPFQNLALLKEALQKGLIPTVIRDDMGRSHAFPVGYLGAPTILLEKLANNAEIVGALTAVRQRCGVDESAAMVMAAEIGGLNGLCALLVSAETSLPVFDGDLMGRAFPELQMTSPTCVSSEECTLCPMACFDEKGQTLLLDGMRSNRSCESLARLFCVESGMKCAVCVAPIHSAELRSTVVCGSVSLAWQIGRAVCRARQLHQNPLTALSAFGIARIARGRVVRMQSDTDKGFVSGTVHLKVPHSGMLCVDFQNENLVVRSPDSSRVLCTVPDLIMLSLDDGQPVATEELRFGLWLNVLCRAANPIFTSERGLSVVGPSAFGLDLPFTRFS